MSKILAMILASTGSLGGLIFGFVFGHLPFFSISYWMARSNLHTSRTRLVADPFPRPFRGSSIVKLN